MSIPPTLSRLERENAWLRERLEAASGYFLNIAIGAATNSTKPQLERTATEGRDMIVRALHKLPEAPEASDGR